MKVPTKAWAVLGVLLTFLMLLNWLGFGGLIMVVRVEIVVFFAGLCLGFYTFVGALAWLRRWIDGRTMRAYVTWIQQENSRFRRRDKLETHN